VVFGEDLRASPPRRTKEILVKPTTSRVTRSLFQVDNMPMRGQGPADHSNSGIAQKAINVRDNVEGTAEKGQNVMGTGSQFVNLVNELHAIQPKQVEKHMGSAGKERVSFGTNMTTDEESSDGGSVDQKPEGAMTAIERFHARKFKGKDEYVSGRRAVLKIIGAGSSKKQRTPIKTHLKEVLNELVGEEMSGRTGRLADDLDMDQQDLDIALQATPSIFDHEHLMGTHVESRQEQ
jgi:hypothetical protein